MPSRSKRIVSRADLARAALLAIALTGSVPAAARQQCTPAQVDEYVALMRAANGQAALLIARVRRRLETEDVACWAKTGDRAMLLELGKRFEAGDGVERDVERAERLYSAAAATSGGTMFIYSPGVGGAPGRVIPVNVGPVVPGLPEGTMRRALLHIEGRAAKPNVRKGLKLINGLAKAGYPPALAYLSAIPKT